MTSDPRAKIFTARAAARQWRQGLLEWTFDVPMPGEPARTGRPERLPYNRMQKRGRAG